MMGSTGVNRTNNPNWRNDAGLPTEIRYTDQPCKSCGGSGEEGHCGHHIQYALPICPRCHGTGFDPEDTDDA